MFGQLNHLLIILGILVPLTATAVEVGAGKTNACPALLQQDVKNLEGDSLNLCRFAGKVLMVVNTASKCGYTGQYEGLQKLYDTYADKGLVIIGIPSNQFGGQEPGSNQQIKSFCQRNYGVTFPMLAKSDVKGSKALPLYQALAEQTRKRPVWNFHKYLIDRKGERVHSFSSRTSPDNPDLIKQIEQWL